MTKRETKERAEFIDTMFRELPHLRGGKFNELLELMRLARRHHRLQERACNGHQTPSGDWDREAAERDERREENLERRIKAICEDIGCTPIFSGDPRGSTVKVIVPSGRSNSWGGEGICVPQ